MKVHFDNSQDYSLAYCHQTIEEVAWLSFQKENSSNLNQARYGKMIRDKSKKLLALACYI